MTETSVGGSSIKDTKFDLDDLRHLTASPPDPLSISENFTLPALPEEVEGAHTHDEFTDPIDIAPEIVTPKRRTTKSLENAPIVRIDGDRDQYDSGLKVDFEQSRGAGIVIVHSGANDAATAFEIYTAPTIEADGIEVFQHKLVRELSKLTTQTSEVSPSFHECLEELERINPNWKDDVELVVDLAKMKRSAAVLLPDDVPTYVAGYIAREVPFVVLPLDYVAGKGPRVTVLTNDEALASNGLERKFYSALAKVAGISDTVENSSFSSQAKQQRPRATRNSPSPASTAPLASAMTLALESSASTLSRDTSLSAHASIDTTPQPSPRKGPEYFAALEEKLRKEGKLR
ncbi:MAG: hypothetical protein KDD70_04400 [Bdellovibrionales bacterium]|nr:hypothetical protein [Bdellovibrionales bacterium]